MERKEWNAMWSDDHHGEDDGPSVHDHHGSSEPDSLLVECLAGGEQGRALELGCGLGSNAVWLAKQGWEVRAVDFSDVAIAQAEKRAEEAGAVVDFVTEDLRELQLEGLDFDLVTLFYVHLPAEQRREILRKAVAALAPGGMLLFVGHDRSDTDWLERHIVGDGDGHGHQHDGEDDEQARVERLEGLKATLTAPDEVVRELEGLAIERAEVVAHDAHGGGELAGTTLVVARRSG